MTTRSWSESLNTSMPARGRFITLEGIEGAGKSTVARALREALEARGIEVVSTREPGGTPLAERLREVVLEKGTEQLSAEAETLLMFAARAVHLDNLIRPALQRGAWVICDRYTDATRAYQGGGRGVSSALIEALAVEIHRGTDPDLTLWLDLPIEQGLARAAARRRAQGAIQVDRFESETLEFFARVHDTYRGLAVREPQRVKRLDAHAPPEVVAAAAWASVESLLQHDRETRA